MNPSDEIINFIMKMEGFRPDAYQPIPGDRWTFGYGSTFIDGRPVKKGDYISEEDAARLLTNRLNSLAESICTKDIPDNVTQNQFDAVLSLVYNIGFGAFTKSNTGQMFYSGKNISQKFHLWNQSQGEVIAGLTTRRAKEQEIYDNSNYDS